jgi:DNA-binding HxlR family transcriptional regulator
MKHNVTKCPAETTIDLIGGRWKTLIIWILFKKPHRFSELQREMDNCSLEKSITQKMLINQLRELEEDGLVHREVFKQVPPKVEYSLTKLGGSLKPVMEALIDWGKKYKSKNKDVKV